MCDLCVSDSSGYLFPKNTPSAISFVAVTTIAVAILAGTGCLPAITSIPSPLTTAIYTVGAYVGATIVVNVSGFFALRRFDRALLEVSKLIHLLEQREGLGKYVALAKNLKQALERRDVYQMRELSNKLTMDDFVLGAMSQNLIRSLDETKALINELVGTRRVDW